MFITSLRTLSGVVRWARIFPPERSGPGLPNHCQVMVLPVTTAPREHSVSVPSSIHTALRCPHSEAATPGRCEESSPLGLPIRQTLLLQHDQTTIIALGFENSVLCPHVKAFLIPPHSLLGPRTCNSAKPQLVAM